MEAKDIIRLPDPRRAVRAELREVVQERGGKARLYTRVKLTGWYFRAGALEYALLIGDAVSDFTRIADDGLSLLAYFDRPIPPARVVTLVYGNVVQEDFAIEIDPQRIPRLDRAKLPQFLS